MFVDGDIVLNGVRIVKVALSIALGEAGVEAAACVKQGVIRER